MSIPSSSSPSGGSVATVVSPSNIAFVKYWGARDLERAVPENASLSMTLRACVTRTTARVADLEQDEILWRGSTDEAELRPPPPAFVERARRHLDLLRARLGVDARFRIATENSFPAAAGIASSASGFSALALATTAALGLQPSIEEASELARLGGSGSATRSVAGGYIQWPQTGWDAASESGGAIEQVAPASHWDLRDVIAIVSSGAKGVSSLDGHRRARSSPFFARRLETLPERLAIVRRALAEQDFATLGREIEAEAIDLHMMAMTSRPPIYYWTAATLDVLAAVRELRADGVPAWSTMDAGANVHVICRPAGQEDVVARLGDVPGVDRCILDGVGDGPRRTAEHLA
ncbi:MAG: diphosphomevalonate decarboxylase [Acidobacteriota bacterium]